MLFALKMEVFLPAEHSQGVREKVDNIQHPKQCTVIIMICANRKHIILCVYLFK